MFFAVFALVTTVLFFFSKSFDVPMDAIKISRALIGCGDSANPLGFHFNNLTQKFELTLCVCQKSTIMIVQVSGKVQKLNSNVQNQAV